MRWWETAETKATTCWILWAAFRKHPPDNVGNSLGIQLKMVKCPWELTYIQEAPKVCLKMMFLFSFGGIWYVSSLVVYLKHHFRVINLHLFEKKDNSRTRGPDIIFSHSESTPKTSPITFCGFCVLFKKLGLFPWLNTTGVKHSEQILVVRGQGNKPCARKNLKELRDVFC